MNRHSLIAIVITLCIASCSSKKGNSDLASLPEDFQSYLNNFPEKALPLDLPANTDYSEVDLRKIDTVVVNKYIPVNFFENGSVDELYYHSIVRMHPGLLSVVIYQKINGSETTESYTGYVLVNYNTEGYVVSAKRLAHQRSGQSQLSSATATINNGDISIYQTKMESDKNATEIVYSYKINSSGTLFPLGIPAELVGNFHNGAKEIELPAMNGYNKCDDCPSVEKATDNYLIAGVFNDTKDFVTTAFKIYTRGDSVFFSGGKDVFDNYINTSGELMVSEFGKSSKGYQFALTNSFTPQDQSVAHLILTPVEGKPGIYKTDLPGYRYNDVVAQNDRASYQTRTPSFVDNDHRIFEDGISGMRIGSPESSVTELAQKNNLIIKTEEDGPTTHHKLYKETSDDNLVLDVRVNSQTKVVESFSLYGCLFNTDQGVGICNSIGDLLYWHENVSATSGGSEDGVRLAIKWYEHVTFIGGVNYYDKPGTEIKNSDLDKIVEISRIDFK